MKHSKEFYMLDAAEWLQTGLYKTIGSEIGAKMIAGVTGSRSKAYGQLLWVPRRTIQSTLVPKAITSERTSSSGLPAINWESAIVLGAQVDELKEMLLDQRGVEAVSYRTENAWRVGRMPLGQKLFGDLGDGMVGLAMRQGNDQVDFSIGKFNIGVRSYIGASTLELIDRDVHVDSLPRQYPGIKLG